MQPSDPTPEELMAREAIQGRLPTMFNTDTGLFEPLAPVRDAADLDAYARAVYQRGVRDGLKQAEQTGYDRLRSTISRIANTPPEPTE